MNNFLQFIEEDIQSKKTLLASMPTNTKNNVKKFNAKVDAVALKYEEYQKNIKQYLDVKSKSYEVKDDKDTAELKKTVEEIEHVRFILNPSNTYFEKMGFDTLFYQIGNYRDFKFSSLNDILNEFLNKFASAGVILQRDDFNYTCYVNEFMTTFLEASNAKSANYDLVADKFEKIYWVNPELIEHIELNFRRLIKKHEKKFIEHINKLKLSVTTEQNLTYGQSLDKLTEAYIKLEHASRENLYDIIELAKAASIDINAYFEDAKLRTTTFSTIVIDPLNMNDKAGMEKFYEDLEKLKSNIMEFANYLKFMPLFKDFKEEYLAKSGEAKADNKGIKALEASISKTEAKLDKLNKKIFGGKLKESDARTKKFETVRLASELHELYKNKDSEYFKSKVLSVLDSTFTISDLLHLYYSFDYFKKSAIKKVYDVSNYEEIIALSDAFDLFAMNPTNVIINGVTLAEESNLAKVIVDKYRLANINITEENMGEEELKVFLEKVEFVLRIKAIEESKTTVDKIWFMVQVSKIK